MAELMLFLSVRNAGTPTHWNSHAPPGKQHASSLACPVLAIPLARGFLGVTCRDKVAEQNVPAGKTRSLKHPLDVSTRKLRKGGATIMQAERRTGTSMRTRELKTE